MARCKGKQESQKESVQPRCLSISNSPAVPQVQPQPDFQTAIGGRSELNAIHPEPEPEACPTCLKLPAVDHFALPGTCVTLSAPPHWVAQGCGETLENSPLASVRYTHTANARCLLRFRQGIEWDRVDRLSVRVSRPVGKFNLLSCAVAV